MVKKGDILGYLVVGGDVALDIYDISLAHGMVLFKASGGVTVSHPPGDLVGVTVMDMDLKIVFEDEMMLTPCPPGINEGDTLQLDFELDPKGRGKMERWVQVK